MPVITVEQCDLSNPSTANTANGTWRRHFHSHSVPTGVSESSLGLTITSIILRLRDKTRLAQKVLSSALCVKQFSLFGDFTQSQLGKCVVDVPLDCPSNYAKVTLDMVRRQYQIYLIVISAMAF